MINPNYLSTRDQLAADPTAILTTYGIGDAMIEVVDNEAEITINTNGGVVFSGNAMAWADDCFDAIEATSQAAEAFDSSPLGELYLKITGITMFANIGAQTL
jgi:hypothetical protein